MTGQTPFPGEYDVEAASAYIKAFNPQIFEQLKRCARISLGQMYWNCVRKQILCSSDFTEQTVRMEGYRPL